MNFAVNVAREIINMSYEIEKLRNEVNELSEYKKKYDELLSNSLSHNQKITGNLAYTFQLAKTGNFNNDH